MRKPCSAWRRSTFLFCAVTVGLFYLSLRDHVNIQYSKAQTVSIQIPPKGNLYIELTIGRLGNHLFQYAALYGIARVNNRIPVISSQTDLVDIFSGISAQLIENKTFKVPVANFEKDGAGKYIEQMCVMPSADVDVMLCCYFQSWKYFKGYENNLRQEFVFKDHLTKGAKLILDDINQKYQLYHNMSNSRKDITYIGLHIRQADMQSGSAVKQGYVTAPKSYITKAMDYYQSQYTQIIFVIATDDEYWVREHFAEELNSHKAFLTGVSGEEPEVDLAVLSSCNHTIMTVGSFGWWAGWLAGGKVVYYENWPKEGSDIWKRYDKEDYFPPDWIPME